MKTALLVLVTIIFTFANCSKRHESSIDLTGIWQFRMDPEDKGISENWADGNFSETVKLPGSMAENGRGYDITLETKWTGRVRNTEWYKDPNFEPYFDPNNIRFPFWLQPVKKYTGAAWYEKKIVIPKEWERKTIRLVLERPHWESTLWINGEKVSTLNSLATPHIYNISSFLKSGDNTIVVRIDNRIKEVDPGNNAHSVTDHTQTNWNGMVGKICLQAVDRINFRDVKVFPDVNKHIAELKIDVNNTLSESKRVTFMVDAWLKNTTQRRGKKEFTFTIKPGLNTIDISYALGEDALLWDEFNPNVYQLSLTLQSGKERDTYFVDFGLRNFQVSGTQFTINGRPIFLRGTLECAIFPKTGYPPTDVEGWEKVFKAVKDHGLNHVRFHSWCPPEAAFEVADAMGVYLQIECSAWARIGEGKPIDGYIWDESKRIVRAYGNHPSFVMMAYGNEPGGPNYIEFLTDFVNYWKGTDNRRVYTSAAGWPELEVNAYQNTWRARIQQVGDPINNILNAQAPSTDFDWSDKMPANGIPLVSHEIGQWCVYPNFKEIDKYTGVLKAKNFEVFKESLNAHQMGNLADSFLLASGKLQALCYKAEIEAALRTRGFAGFQLLDLHDFPGQGTALVGVLDPFWEEKGYITPDEYRRFCNSTVPLARLKKRIFIEGETITADVEVAHFGQKPLNEMIAVWKLSQGSKIVVEGKFDKCDIPIGNGIKLGQVAYEIKQENIPRKLVLEVELGSFKNSWDIWVYPKNKIPDHKDIKVVQKLDGSSLDYLTKGGKVLLTLGKGLVSTDYGGHIGLGFSTIFWNTAWFPNQELRTLGILCDPKHHALEQFPTEYHSNWQWWDLIRHADAIQLDSLTVELKPIVRVIDDWFSNRRLALLFEAKVGKGSILVSGIDLMKDMDERPEARQLLTSITEYMAGADFSPHVTLKSDQIKQMIR